MRCLSRVMVQLGTTVVKHTETCVYLALLLPCFLLFIFTSSIACIQHGLTHLPTYTSSPLHGTSCTIRHFALFFTSTKPIGEKGIANLHICHAWMICLMISYMLLLRYLTLLTGPSAFFSEFCEHSSSYSYRWTMSIASGQLAKSSFFKKFRLSSDLFDKLWLKF